MFRVRWKPGITKTLKFRLSVLAAALLVATASVASAEGWLSSRALVGQQPDGSVLVPTDQVITPAGDQIMMNGQRPNAVALSPDGHTAAFLTASCNGCSLITTIDRDTGKVKQQLNPQRGGAAATGIIYSADGQHLYASDTAGFVLQASVAADGTLTQQATIPLPTPSVGWGSAYPEGLALSPDGALLYVAMSRSNALGVIDLATHQVVDQIPVGNAPWGVAVEGGSVYVTNEGGRPAQPGDFTNDSSGTRIVADPNSGSAVTGTVSVVDTVSRKVVASADVGNHPTSMHVDGRYVFVANTNSDSVSVLDSTTNKVVKTITVKPFPGAPLGSSPQSVTMLPGGQLVVALGNNNGLAFYHWLSPSEPVSFQGLVPTAWYPADIAVDPARKNLVVANVKGVGSLGNAGSPSKAAYAQVGTASVIPFPGTADLAKGTDQVFRNNRWDRLNVLAKSKAMQCDNNTNKAGNPNGQTQNPGANAPVPAWGGCSPIKHVFFIIKENRTYDQVLGDMPTGNGNTVNTTFGANVTPNQHALASRFPQLDNYYASGIASDEGHQWLNEAWVTSYLEKMEYGGPERAYPYDGGDALAYAPTGFLWQNATRSGLTVRDYGEFAAQFTGPTGSINNWSDPATWQKFYQDSQILSGQQQGKLNTPLGTYTAKSDVPSLKNVLSPTYPPFNTASIPDQYRAQIFLQEFNNYEKNHNLPNLSVLTLPQDHTVGTAPGMPTPNAMVADNDLALGKIVDAISHSPDWKDSAIFVTEDDAQSGLDHVDGHRTTGFVISPYTRTGVVNTTYTQIDMVRTIEQILGMPAMNQADLAANPMFDAFTNKPNFAPFTALPNQIPLNQLAPAPAPAPAATSAPATTGSTQSNAETARQAWTQWSDQAFKGASKADQQDTNHLNRAIWYGVKGYDTPYPGDNKVLLPNEVPQANAG
jgi:YVTN family beta-propeller protein